MSKRNNKIILPAIAIGSLASVGVLSTMLFPASGVNAESSAGAEIGTTISGFIRLALDTDDVALKDGENTIITPSASGTLATGSVNLAVTTNTEAGFSISVYTQDASTAMTHSNPNVSATIPSVSGATGYDATTGISDLASNTWGFRKKTGESEGTPTYGNWFSVGADETHGTVIENSNSSSSEYCATLAYPLASSGCDVGTYAEHTLNFGANLTSSLPAGTYANNIVVSAVAKSEGQKYSVSFNSNGGNNTAGSRTIVAGSTFTMPTITNVTKPGYEIAGYAFTSDAASATYTPGQTVTVSDFLAAATSAGQTPDSGMTLYLIWQESVAYMQDFNCSSLSNGESATLIDTRDSSNYTVKKFADNQCWMTQNLRLGYDKGYTLTHEDTNMESGKTYYLPSAGYRGDINSASTLTSTNAATFDGNNDNQAHVQYAAAGNITIWVPDDSWENVTPTEVVLPQDTGYYNFYAATLGFSYYGAPADGDAPEDICPKGWQLPTYDENSEKSWYYFYNTLNGGSDANMMSPSGGALINTGYYYGMKEGQWANKLLRATYQGGYWSSNTSSSVNGHNLYVGEEFGADPQDFANKNIGFAVRCTAK